MNKGLILSFFVILFSLSMTGCTAIDGVLDTFLNHSKLTVEQEYIHLSIDGHSGRTVDYRDFKATFDGQEYTALGTYEVPNNTVVHMSWSYNCDYCTYGKWKTASTDISVGSFENLRVMIKCDEVSISR